MFTEREKLVTVIRAIKDQATFQLHTPEGRLPTAPTVFQINLRLGFFTPEITVVKPRGGSGWN